MNFLKKRKESKAKNLHDMTCKICKQSQKTRYGYICTNCLKYEFNAEDHMTDGGFFNGGDASLWDELFGGKKRA